MLRLTLEIVPFGIESHTRPIGMMHIGLRHIEPGNLGQYHVWIYQADGELTKELDIHDHPRENGAWELVRRAVEAYAIPEGL